ncbi:ABC transporter ATP-binding protein [Vibrio mimicus]|uniref:ABC transporter ATP-binding protein n=1 Tax=Vibrio mimicus TaxID=674 RepID=A0A2J9V045_VIBMI|nr:ABC transporter ATP-binding protein [Vibrio mimicus]EEW11829.1 ABC transporter protein abcA [Vibrio mimicus VM573]EGU18504.1 methyl-transferase [Vibrio mimicus SX-4]KFE30209.1 ABC transporter family protein [Vibrio mimicus]PNM57156.1 ABC transporter ATP-binding protein [Vibrio mimicus]BCN22312.1 putative O-antigen export system, ATP binding protein [Vibrio mimicus]
MSSNIVISANNISKGYVLYEKPHHCLKRIISSYFTGYDGNISNEPINNQFWALKNVSMDLRKNETLGIIGQNGSGKSTLLQIICGTLSPTSGSTKTQGKVAALLELGAGFNPEYTGRENVYLNASMYGLSAKDIEEKMNSIIDFSEIGEHIDQPVKTYSSGMYVRLAFSVIANIDADILVIDEALAVGDAHFQQKCMRFLNKFKEHGSIFFVSHDTSAMISFCDRVVWLHKGEVVASGNPKTVCEEYLSFLHQEHTGQGSGCVSELKVAKAVSSDNQNARSFGDGAAQITNCMLTDSNDNKIVSIEKRTDVKLKISFQAKANLESIIVGFIVKDRLGQYLFGENTFDKKLSVSGSMSKGEFGQVTFSFEMPTFAPGTYSVAVAIASGTPNQHIQHHWIHEAIIFTSLTDIDSGIMFSIPMKDIHWT